MAKQRATSWQNPASGARSTEYLAVATVRGDVSGSTVQVFEKHSWTVGFWYKPTSDFVSGETYYLFHVRIDANNYWAMKINGTTSIPYFEISSGGSAVSSYNASDTALVTDNWYFLAAYGDLDNFTMTISGMATTTNTVSYTLPVGTLPTYMYIGSDYNGANQANGNYSNYIILPYKATIDQLFGYVGQSRPFSLLPRVEVEGTLINRPKTNPLICDGTVNSVDIIEASLEQRYKVGLELTESPTLLSVLTQEQEEEESTPEQETYIIIGYVNGDPDHSGVDVTKITHMFWAFAEPNPDAGQYIKALESWEVTWVNTMTNLRDTQNPNMKAIISVGGWGAGGSGGGQGDSGFETAMANASNRAQFATDCNYLINTYDLDGIDIDCEYPGVADKDKFTLLIAAIRSAIGWNKWLSITTPAGTTLCSQSFDLAGLKSYCDCIAVMCYDMDSSGEKHHSNLYVSGLSSVHSCEIAMNYHKGIVPVGQLAMGVPFYGYIDGVGAKTFDQFVSTYINLNGYTRYWDDTAKEPYLLKTGTFQGTYDDTVSLAVKMQYIKDQKFAGTMIWQLRQNSDKTLLNTIYNALG